jgi:TfoX/Sxy family transcriptional regulator of competence genes
MASDIQFVEYVCSQISGAGHATYLKMFGEYGIYINGKIIALICDDQFFLKITEAGRKIIRESIEAPAYPGSKPFFLIEDLEDRDYLTDLITATYKELPEPKPKQPSCKKAVKNDLRIL